MKKQIYIFLAMVLGVLLTTILHGVVEVFYIGLLMENFDKYNLGLSWDAIYIVHYVFTIVLAVLGIIGGYFLGQRWWRIVYIEKRHWWFRRKLAAN